MKVDAKQEIIMHTSISDENIGWFPLKFFSPGILSFKLPVNMCLLQTFLYSEQYHKVYKKKLNMNKCPKIIAFKPHLNIWMGELNLNRFSVWWKKRAWYLLLCSRMHSLKNRKQFLLEMSESIHKPLHSFRHKYLSLKDIIIFLAFFDAVRNQHILNLKDINVGVIIVAQVKHELFE